MRFMMILAATAAMVGSAAVWAKPVAVPHYVVSGSIAGPDGSWDYARVDAAARRLYVARSASVTVVNLTDNIVSFMGIIMRGHAVVPLPGHRLLVTSGNDSTVRFLDAASGKQLASIAVGKKPDAAIYDAPRHRAFVMNADSGTVSVIDTTAMRVTATIPVKEALEYAALGSNGTLFVNNEEANEIEVVDVAHSGTGTPIAMPGCEAPTGLAYDARHDRLISSCANGKAAIVDAKTRRMIALLDIGKGADAVILDETRRLAFIPCGRDGVLDILSLDAPGGVANAGRVTTEIGARTGALDSRTGIIYLPSARYAAPAVTGARPAIVPGSFHILVVKPS